jgi:hypothetical protein
MTTNDDRRTPTGARVFPGIDLSLWLNLLLALAAVSLIACGVVETLH